MASGLVTGDTLEVQAPAAPDFIKFLFSTKTKFDCYFVVGNISHGEPERIGAAKLMLMAHSEVFRLQLEESDLAEKGDVPVKDVNPDTFKGMLKYVYGHDTTSELCFDDADNMLYVAEKYMIKTLKDKLAARLMKLLKPDNICSLLNNPACFTHLELDSAITEILRFETDRVIACPEFLSVNDEGFLKILEQDSLAVPEIELWRAAIKWAKHRANSEDGKELRQEISGLTEHLRLCTLTEVEVFEVIPSDILSIDEIKALCLFNKTKEHPIGLTDFSSKTEPRKRLERVTKMQNSLEIPSELPSVKNALYHFKILTKKNSIELLPLVIKPACRSFDNPENWTYKVDCTATLTKEVNPNNPDSSSTEEPPITISYNENVKYGVEFEIPLAVDGNNIILSPDTKYTVEMQLTGDHTRYSKTSPLESAHLRLMLSLVLVVNRGYDYAFPSKKLQYRVLNRE